MASRLDLQIKLEEEILGSRNVYFQPPASIKMKYPAIRFSLSDIFTNHADDSIYKRMNRYEIIVIDYDPESEIVNKLLTLPYCSFDRFYTSDNLNHFVFTLYF